MPLVLSQIAHEQFNSAVKYRECILKWDTVIEQKTTQLSRFLSGRSREIDFIEPSPIRLFAETEPIGLSQQLYRPRSCLSVPVLDPLAKDTLLDYAPC